MFTVNMTGLMTFTLKVVVVLLAVPSVFVEVALSFMVRSPRTWGVVRLTLNTPVVELPEPGIRVALLEANPDIVT